jgi:hypothetical protein
MMYRDPELEQLRRQIRALQATCALLILAVTILGYAVLVP